jgi:ATP-dependent Lon protease
MAKSTLPVLVLPLPLILIPASRITIQVTPSIGVAIHALIDESDALPVIAVVPLANDATSPPLLSEWATTARVVRLVRPTPRNPRQPYLLFLHGLNRVHLGRTNTDLSFPQEDLLFYDVEYPPTELVPSNEVVEKFKYAGMNLLDRLARDSTQLAKKESYSKIAGMLQDITSVRAAWMADVLIGAINGEYSDKLGSLLLLKPPRNDLNTF